MKRDKELLSLKKLVEKVIQCCKRKTAQGYSELLQRRIIPKGTKFTQKVLQKIDDFAFIDYKNWTTSDD